MLHFAIHRWPVGLLLVGVMASPAAFGEKKPPADLVTALLAESVINWRVSKPVRTLPKEPTEHSTDNEWLSYYAPVVEDLYEHGGTVTIPAEVQARLLAACLDHPEHLARFLPLLPCTPEAFAAMKKVFDAPLAGFKPDEDWKQAVHDFLMMRTSYFHRDLMDAARALKFTRSGDLENEEMRAALAKLDWREAEPLLREDAGLDSHFAVGAIGMLYEHELDQHDEKSATAFRNRLMKLAADPHSTAFVRDRAFAPLIAHDWPGRSEWFKTLFSDRSLDSLSEGIYGYQNPLEMWANAAPDQALAVAAPALAEPALRKTASYVLLATDRPAALRLLLPCLEHPEKWDEKLPRYLIGHLRRMDFPESSPFLVAWLSHPENDQRVEAALALAHQKAKEAPAALKGVLPQVDWQEAHLVVAALLATKEYSAAEIAAAIEAGAADELANEKRHETGRTPAICVSDTLLDLAANEPGVAEAVLKRIAELRPEQSCLAARMWLRIGALPSPAIDRECLRRIQTEAVTPELAEFALRRRDRMKAEVAAGLRTLAEGDGARAGLAAALMGEPRVAESMLKRDDVAAQETLLAAARLAGTELPLAMVGKAMDAKGAALRRAAERYLLANDSSEARELVRAHHPGELIILGQDELLPDDVASAELNGPASVENPGIKLIKEMQAKDAPDEIFALFSGGGFGDDGQRIMRIRNHKGTLAFTDAGKVQQIIIKDEDLKRFLAFVQEKKVDDLSPLFNPGVFDGVWYDYYHLTKTTGRHIYINNPNLGEGPGTMHGQFVRLFRGLSNQHSPPPVNAVVTQ